jgi:hypothetical protein
MKKLKIWLGAFALGAGTLQAQTDTVKVYQTDSVETNRVVHDTVVKVQPPPPTPPVQPEPKKEEIPLRWGELGVRFMPTVTYLSVKTYSGDVVQATTDVNYGYGAFLGINFSKNIGIVGEVDYLDIFQKYKDQELERQVHLNYLNIPVMLSLNTDKTKPVNLNVVVGPQFGVMLGSSANANNNGGSTNATVTVAAKSGDIGLAYGAGLEFALNPRHTFRLDLGFRGMYGLANLSGDQTGADAYTVTFSGARKAYGGYAGFTILW